MIMYFDEKVINRKQCSFKNLKDLETTNMTEIKL